jgi:hypothetical protein
VARCGSLIAMSANRIHPGAADVSAELVEVAGGGLRVAEVGVVILLGLLVCPPLLILAVVVANTNGKEPHEDRGHRW